MGEENKCNEDDYPWELGVYHCGFAIPLWGKHLRILDKRERERERERLQIQSLKVDQWLLDHSHLFILVLFLLLV